MITKKIQRKHKGDPPREAHRDGFNVFVKKYKGIQTQYKGNLAREARREKSKMCLFKIQKENKGNPAREARRGNLVF